jgi:M6 family metalloprotease-like protein
MDRAGTNWSQYDQDGDGVLDSIVILHSRFAAEGGGTDCINNKEMGTNQIWSHRSSVSGDLDGWSSKDKSVWLGQYAAASAVHGFCGHNITRIGILGHEMLHMLGLPYMIAVGSSFGYGIGDYNSMAMIWDWMVLSSLLPHCLHGAGCNWDGSTLTRMGCIVYERHKYIGMSIKLMLAFRKENTF